jgi:hypothetical protein
MPERTILEPVKWAAGRKERFETWFQQEFANTIGDRAPLERKWRGAMTQWRASRPQGTKDFPYPGASDEEFPLTAIHSDPVLADFIQSLHAPEDFWTPVARRGDRAQHATPLREALTAIDRTFLHLRRVNERALLDMVVLGTAIYKTRWKEERKKIRDYMPDGRIGDIVRNTSHPLVEHVPLQHFYIPAAAWDIDPDKPGGAQWVAQRFQMRGAELKHAADAESPFLPAYDKALVKLLLGEDTKKPDSGGTGSEADRSREDIHTVDAKIRSLDEYVPWQDKKITFYEVWVRFDVDGDGIEEDFVVVWNHDLAKIMRSHHYPYLHGKRPFHATRYLPSFGFYGIGMAEIDEWAQATASRLLNAQVDNVLLSNTRAFGVPQGAGFLPGQTIYPGATVPLGPNERLQEIRLSDIYQSLPQTISQILQFAEMRTAVSELRQGNITGLPSRTPATTILSILREGNKRFDMILSNFRDVWGEIGLRLLQLMAQFYREDEQRWGVWFIQTLGEKDAAAVIEVLAGKVHGIETSFGITVTATSAQVNKEVEKQSYIGLMQILSQIGMQLIQLAQVIEQMPEGSPSREAAIALFTGGVELTNQLLQRFDIQNPDQYLGNLEAISHALAAQSQGQNPATAGLQQGGMMQGGGVPMMPPGAGGMISPQQLGGGLGLV